MSITNQTTYNLLEKFIKIGILKKLVGKKRNRIFEYDQLLQILKNKE